MSNQFLDVLQLINFLECEINEEIDGEDEPETNVKIYFHANGGNLFIDLEIFCKWSPITPLPRHHFTFTLEELSNRSKEDSLFIIGKIITGANELRQLAQMTHPNRGAPDDPHEKCFVGIDTSVVGESVKKFEFTSSPWMSSYEPEYGRSPIYAVTDEGKKSDPIEVKIEVPTNEEIATYGTSVIKSSDFTFAPYPNQFSISKEDYEKVARVTRNDLAKSLSSVGGAFSSISKEDVDDSIDAIIKALSAVNEDFSTASAKTRKGKRKG